ncbi:MAG: TonB family protein [Acidobacteriota bacterium]|nr:TonB family protein [Acidobacteriota bacterium]
MKKMLMIVSVLVLAACSVAPKIYLASEPLEVAVDELDDYWIESDEPVRFEMPAGSTPGAGQEGFARVRFLIDSNGKVHNPEVVESEPEGVWDQHGVKAVMSREYRPSEENDALVPVYVTSTVTFNYGSQPSKSAPATS